MKLLLRRKRKKKSACVKRIKIACAVQKIIVKAEEKKEGLAIALERTEQRNRAKQKSAYSCAEQQCAYSMVDLSNMVCNSSKKEKKSV